MLVGNFTRTATACSTGWRVHQGDDGARPNPRGGAGRGRGGGGGRGRQGREWVAPLSAVSLELATAQYTGVGALRKLTHDEARGGVTVKLVRARWLLEHFQAAGREGARLEHQQALERDTNGDGVLQIGEFITRR